MNHLTGGPVRQPALPTWCSDRPTTQPFAARAAASASHPHASQHRRATRRAARHCCNHRCALRLFDCTHTDVMCRHSAGTYLICSLYALVPPSSRLAALAAVISREQQDTHPMAMHKQSPHRCVSSDFAQKIELLWPRRAGNAPHCSSGSMLLLATNSCCTACRVYCCMMCCTVSTVAVYVVTRASKL